MAFKRGYRRRGMRRRRTGGRRYGFFGKAGYMASKAWKMAKYLKSVINVERKYIDYNQAPAQITTTGTVLLLSGANQGTDYNQRDGLSAKMVSLNCRYTCELPSGFASPEGQYIRLIWFIDQETGTPAVSDVLETTSIVSPLNHLNGKRFSILYDKVHFLSIAGQTGIQRSMFKRMQSHLKWSNATTGLKEGHVYVLLLSDASTAGTEPFVSFYNRIRFIDN